MTRDACTSSAGSKPYESCKHQPKTRRIWTVPPAKKVMASSWSLAAYASLIMMDLAENPNAASNTKPLPMIMLCRSAWAMSGIRLERIFYLCYQLLKFSLLLLDSAA